MIRADSKWVLQQQYKSQLQEVLALRHATFNRFVLIRPSEPNYTTKMKALAAECRQLKDSAQQLLSDIAALEDGPTCLICDNPIPKDSQRRVYCSAACSQKMTNLNARNEFRERKQAKYAAKAANTLRAAC